MEKALSFSNCQKNKIADKNCVARRINKGLFVDKMAVFFGLSIGIVGL